MFAGRTAVWRANRLIGRGAQLRPMFEACVLIAPPHWRDKQKRLVTITNCCELDIEPVRVGNGHPRTIALPVNRTSLIQFEAPADAETEGHTYKATNFLVGPDEPMKVELRIPE